jgi:glycosyltransferase involved in cell wall biosynthesis
MALAVEAFVSLLDDAAAHGDAQILRVNIASDRSTQRFRHYCSRSVRVAKAVIALLNHRRQAVAYVSVDAGLGMVYTLALVATARLAHTRIYLHHHSAAYLRFRNRRFAALCALGSADATHLVGGTAMVTMLQRNYPTAARVTVLPILYAVSGSPQVSRMIREPWSQTKPIILGHLSNLTLDKGLDLVFDTVEAIRRTGQPCELVLAGPARSAGACTLIKQRMETLGDASRYLGPLRAEERERFFDMIDLFLFPSTYSHETFGLVVGEALTRGCPVISYQNPCLTPGLVGDAGLVLPTREAFPDRATEWITALGTDNSKYLHSVETALSFSLRRDAAVASARIIATAIVESAVSG